MMASKNFRIDMRLKKELAEARQNLAAAEDLYKKAENRKAIRDKLVQACDGIHFALLDLDKLVDPDD